MSPEALGIGAICGAIVTIAFILGGGKPAVLNTEYPAKLFRSTGTSADEGTIQVQDSRVVFAATNGDRTTIWLNEIEVVLPASIGGIVPNGMVVRTKGGDEYQFALPNRNGMIGLIERVKKSVSSA